MIVSKKENCNQKHVCSIHREKDICAMANYYDFTMPRLGFTMLFAIVNETLNTSFFYCHFYVHDSFVFYQKSKIYSNFWNSREAKFRLLYIIYYSMTLWNHNLLCHIVTDCHVSFLCVLLSVHCWLCRKQATQSYHWTWNFIHRFRISSFNNSSLIWNAIHVIDSSMLRCRIWILFVFSNVVMVVCSSEFSQSL